MCLFFTPLKHDAQKRIKMYRKEKGKNVHAQMDKMNVIILGMGGVSRMDFKSKFSKTREYLEMKLKAVEMERFNHIGGYLLFIF